MAKSILIFSPDYSPFMSGAEIAVKEITDRLPEFEFHLFCAHRAAGTARMERVGNVTIHRVGLCAGTWNKYMLPFFAPLVACRRFPADTVACAWSLMASYGGFAALFYCWLRPRTKFLLTLQEGDPLEHYARRSGVFDGLRHKIFRRADTVQAISTFLAAWAQRMGFTGEPVVIPNGVDMARFTTRRAGERREDLRRSLGYGPEDVVLVTTSRLSLKNGVDDLIRSLLFLPEHVKALIIGDGEDAASLSTLVEQKGLHTRVHFLGRRSQEELPSLLWASDVFVRPSLSEGLGNSFLEAMAVGLPIIGTPVGGIPDFLRDGETGVFCASRDPSSIARAVLRIQSEPGLIERLTVRGRETVEASYTWDGIAVRMRTLFSHLSKKGVV